MIRYLTPISTVLVLIALAVVYFHANDATHTAKKVEGEVARLCHKIEKRTTLNCDRQKRRSRTGRAGVVAGSGSNPSGQSRPGGGGSNSQHRGSQNGPADGPTNGAGPTPGDSSHGSSAAVTAHTDPLPIIGKPSVCVSGLASVNC